MRHSTVKSLASFSCAAFSQSHAIKTVRRTVLKGVEVHWKV